MIPQELVNLQITTFNDLNVENVRSDVISE